MDGSFLFIYFFFISVLSTFKAHMALYSFANGQIIPALRLLYRARYLAVLIYGDDHPDMALLDVSNKSIIHTSSFKSVIYLEFL